MGTYGGGSSSGLDCLGRRHPVGGSWVFVAVGRDVSSAVVAGDAAVVVAGSAAAMPARQIAMMV